jgi:hypothetical protein
MLEIWHPDIDAPGGLNSLSQTLWRRARTHFSCRCVIEHGGCGPPVWFLWEGSISSSPYSPMAGDRDPGAPRN